MQTRSRMRTLIATAIADLMKINIATRKQTKVKYVEIIIR